MSLLPKSLARDAAGNLAAKAALVVLGLGITFTVARIGPQVQGAFALFVACEAVLLTLFSGFGLALAREVSHRKSDAAGALTAALLASLAVGLVAAGAVALLSQLLPREPYRHLWLLAGATPFLLMVPTATGLWMGQGRMLPLNLAQVAAPAAVLALLGAWVWTQGMGGTAVFAVLAVWVIGKSLVGLGTAAWAFHDAGRAAPAWELLRRDARFVVVVGLTNVVSLLNYRITLFVIEHYGGLAQAGIYSVAVQVGELLWLLSSAVTVSVYHRIGDPDRTVAAAMTVRAVRINVLATLAAAPLLWLLAWVVLPRLLGPAYQDARWPLACLLPGLAAYAAASSLSAFYTNHMGRPQTSAMVAGLSLLLNLAGSLWAVPRYGAVGAALSTSLSYVLAIGVAVAIFLKQARWPVSAFWRLPAAAGNTADNPALPPRG